MKNIKYAVAGVIAFIFLVLGASMHETVPVGEEAAVSSWGEVQVGVVKRGAGFKAPWETYDTYNLQGRTYEVTGAKIPSQDKFKTSMNIVYTGNYIPGYADKTRMKTGTSSIFLNTHVHRTVLSCAVNAGSSIETSQDFFLETKQVDMANYINDCVNEYLRTPKVGGNFEITKVQFSDIQLDPRVEKFMIKTKDRIEAENQQESDARIKESKATEQVAEAKAKAEAAAFEATGRRALADARLYEVQQEAAGNILLGKSVTPNLSSYVRANKWDGKYPNVMAGENTELQIRQ